VGGVRRDGSFSQEGQAARVMMGQGGGVKGKPRNNKTSTILNYRKPPSSEGDNPFEKRTPLFRGNRRQSKSNRKVWTTHYIDRDNGKRNIQAL